MLSAEPINFTELDKVVLYDSALDGIETVEDGFSGNIQFNEETVGLFAANYPLKTGNELLDKIIPATVEMIRNTLMVDFMRQTIGTSPGWFSMINERFEEAKKYIFCKEGDSETYSVIFTHITAILKWNKEIFKILFEYLSSK